MALEYAIALPIRTRRSAHRWMQSGCIRGVSLVMTARWLATFRGESRPSSFWGCSNRGHVSPFMPTVCGYSPQTAWIVRDLDDAYIELLDQSLNCGCGSAGQSHNELEAALTWKWGSDKQLLAAAQNLNVVSSPGVTWSRTLSCSNGTGVSEHRNLAPSLICLRPLPTFRSSVHYRCRPDYGDSSLSRAMSLCMAAFLRGLTAPGSTSLFKKNSAVAV